MRIQDRADAAFRAWGALVVRRRFAVALVMLAVTAAFGSLLPRLQTDNSTESFLREDDPTRVEYDRFREAFGQDEWIVLTVRPPRVFDLGFLRRLRALHLDIEREVPHVDEVTSLWNARHTRGESDGLVVGDLMEDWPETAADLAALRSRVFDTPAYRNLLVNDDGTLTTITLEPRVHSSWSAPGAEGEATFSREPLTDAESLELTDALRRVVERHAGADFEVRMAGGPVAPQAMNRHMQRDLSRFLAIGLGLMSVLLFAVFRRASGVVLPLVVVLLSVVVTYGAMALLGIPNSVSANVVPILVLCVGTCSAVHLLTIAYQRLGEGASRADAIADALGHSGYPVFMAALTTAGGLLSLASAEMAQARNLGLTAPIGVMLTFVYSVTLLPALLAIAPLRASRYGSDSLQRHLAGRLAAVGDFAVRRPGAVLTATAALVLVAGLGVAQLRLSQNGLHWLPEHDEVRQASELLNDEFGGGSSVEVWLDAGRDYALHDPELMRAIDRAIAHAETIEEGGGELYVGKAISLLDIVKETHRALHENRPEFYAIPDSADLLAQELLLFESSGVDDLEELTDTQYRTARVSLLTPFVDAALYPRFTAQIQEGFQRLLGGAVDVKITGIGAIFGRTIPAVNETLARSYVIALAVITPLMVLLIGHLRLGLTSMLPNLVPIWLTLGLMGALGVPIDASSLLLGPVLIGLAVDDSIHFMLKYRSYQAAGADPRTAVRRTLTSTGVALLITSFVLVSAFGVLTVSYMNNLVAFGSLAAFAAAAAFLADLVLAPSLVALVGRRGSGQGRAERATARFRPRG